MAATGTPTPNIGLRRPQGTDPASVDDINYNSNLIDTKMGPVGNSSLQEQINSLNSNLGTKVTIFSTGSVPANGSVNIEVSRGRIYVLVCGGAYATGSMYIIFGWTAGSGRVQTVKSNSAVTVSIDADRIVTIASTEGISYSFIDIGAFV